MDALAEGLGGADLTTLLLEVMRRRAAVVTPADVMRQYARDRFVAPGVVSLRNLREVEGAALGALPAAVETVVLAPVAPLAAHSAIATVDQHRVVTTVRRSEVVADPTNVLALEAAVRRTQYLDADRRSAQRISLATVQRVMRAQRFEGADSFSHFSMLAMVTAGRDTGNRTFEREVVLEHAGFVVAALMAAGAEAVRIEISALPGSAMEDVVADVLAVLATRGGVEARAVHDRDAGVGYYEGVALRGEAVISGETVECADGGLVDWTQRLLENRKERLMIVGIGLDRLAMRMPPR